MLPRDGRPRRLRGHHADPHAPHGRPRGHLEALPPRVPRAEGWRHRRAHREPVICLHKATQAVSFIVSDVIRSAVRAMGPYWPLVAVAVAAILTLPVAVLVFVPHPFS